MVSSGSTEADHGLVALVDDGHVGRRVRGRGDHIGRHAEVVRDHPHRPVACVVAEVLVEGLGDPERVRSSAGSTIDWNVSKRSPGLPSPITPNAARAVVPRMASADHDMARLGEMTELSHARQSPCPSGCQAGSASSKPANSKPGDTVQLTKVNSPVGSAACQAPAGTTTCGR